jgi:hypothetical protein
MARSLTVTGKASGTRILQNFAAQCPELEELTIPMGHENLEF